MEQLKIFSLLPMTSFSPLEVGCEQYTYVYTKQAPYSGHIVYVAPGDGEVYVWDLTNRACIHKFRDKGCVSGQCISASPDGQVIVCG